MISHHYRNDWLKSFLARVELLTLREAILSCDGNASAAARTLGISRSTMHRKISEDNEALARRAAIAMAVSI